MRFDYDYVIVGGGMAADAAVRGIREVDPDGSVVVLGEDADAPYERPPLSKDLWRGGEDDPQDPEEVFLGTADVPGVDVRTSTRVTSVDRDARTVVANDDDVYGYGVLLLVTGGRPRELGSVPGAHVVYFRTVGDYHRVRSLVAPAGNGTPRRVVVVGGGFVGTELAAGLAMVGAKVTYLTPADVVGAATYPPTLARRIEATFGDHGVEVVTRARAQRLEHTGADPVVVHATVSGDPVTLAADVVVLGLGIEPNVELAVAAGLEVSDDDGGVVVDADLRTADPAVLAAGDVASYPDALLGRRRVEHADHAQVSGRAAGRNMAHVRRGEDLEPYEHTPFFWSDLFDLGYEAVGDLDASLDVVEDWAPDAEGETGVVYYVGTADDGPEGGLRGVLLWNVWDSTDAARALLRELGAEGSVTGRDDLRGRIPTS